MNEYLKELQEIVEQEKNLEDGIYDDEVVPSSYDITSYGIDFDVEGVVRRLESGRIYIPSFQRNFVWKLPESSRFIESLLLGLPVPGIFLAQDEKGRHLVIDGQQRLLTLKFFYNGDFNPQPNAVSKRIFKLTHVQESFNNKRYEDLSEKDRNELGNCVIHATVVKQESPPEDDTSIYHIFERLNSGGRKLTAQEIRTAVYRGKLIDLLIELNMHDDWRAIFGEVNDRMRDQELILRFFAMLDGHEGYKKPMLEFLNKYCIRNRNASKQKLEYLREVFKKTSTLFKTSIEDKIFRPVRALNVAVYETCMVGLAKRLLANRDIDSTAIKSAYENLMADVGFLELISQSTTDAINIEKRIELGNQYFTEA